MAFCQPSLATDHFYFTYPDRASLLADGWDFLAHTVAGDARNTEQTTGAVVSYDQMAHPGVLRIPVDTGDLWGSANNTRKSLFRNLPSNWMSMRLKLSFAPTQNYQEAGLTVYQDDDNYVQIIRDFSDGNEVSFNSEQNGAPVTLVSTSLTQTTLYLRLNRDVTTDTISASYSVDGTNWTALGSIVQRLINPRFAITSGGSLDGFPNADLSWAEVDADPNSPPTYLNIYPGNLLFKMTAGGAPPSQTINVLSSVPGSVVGWSQAVNVPWLQASPASDITPGSLTVSVNSAGLASGVYSGIVNISPNISGGATAVVAVTLIVNPDIPVSAGTWKNGRSGAMSTTTDDGYGSCFDQQTQNGLTGTYLDSGYAAPSFYTQYYNAGMEIGAQLSVPVCTAVSPGLLTQYITENVQGLCSPNTPASCSSIATLAWPCGFTNPDEEYISNQYFTSSRGYNFNQLEETTPRDFQNLNSYNSHEHTPYPPSDFKTVVDAAVQQGKWANLVFHSMCNDDGAIAYSARQNIWVAPVGTVIKYILQRDRVVFTNYQATSQQVSFSVMRLAIPRKPFLSVEGTITSADTVTLQVSLPKGSQVSSVSVNGVNTSYEVQTAGNGPTVYLNTKLDTSVRTVQVMLGNPLVSITVSPANASVAMGLTQAFSATGTYSDNSTQNITSSVTWSSSNTAAATITSAGVATGVAAGSTTIKATSGSVNGSTGLTVTPAQLVSLAVTPANGSLAVNATQAYTATGTYTDGSTQNLTASVTWSSSNTAVATITAAGVATGVAAGNTTIQASSGGTSGSTGLTVGTASLPGLVGR
ncbi:MAG TPA: Ig-like domain-containing protein, partial [Terriglobia bacterium]|nr:Ig-like domain-containing protein [Terriglobia bacterium]